MPTSAGPGPHLTWAELACHDQARTIYPVEYRNDPTRLLLVVAAFEVIREGPAEGKPVGINSAYRTPLYNMQVGGAPQSQHVQGRALDLQPPAHLRVVEFFHRIVRLATDRPELHLHYIKGYGSRFGDSAHHVAARRGWVHVDVYRRGTKQLVTEWEA